MANIITAGNSTNGGTAITTDTSGTLNIVTGSGSGATAVTVDGSGNIVVTGTLTASGGVTGSLKSATAASASGTSIDFTSIPAGVKRITVIFQGVSTNGTSNYLIQIGSGSVINTGYLGAAQALQASAVSSAPATSTSGFIVATSVNLNTELYSGTVVLTNISGNIWIETGSLTNSTATRSTNSSGSVTLSGVLDRVRITSVTPDTFDAGTINILYE